MLSSLPLSNGTLSAGDEMSGMALGQVASTAGTDALLALGFLRSLEGEIGGVVLDIFNRHAQRQKTRKSSFPS